MNKRCGRKIKKKTETYIKEKKNTKTEKSERQEDQAKY